MKMVKYGHSCFCWVNKSLLVLLGLFAEHSFLANGCENQLYCEWKNVLNVSVETELYLSCPIISYRLQSKCWKGTLVLFVGILAQAIITDE